MSSLHKLEGLVTYLVLAAPVIAATAALIPPIAEETWRDGAPLKALLWWAVRVPAGAVVFFSAAERVHAAKAGAETERSVLRGAASRAEATLVRAEAELVTARAGANTARGQKQCGPVDRHRGLTPVGRENSRSCDADRRPNQAPDAQTGGCWPAVHGPEC